jgi:6-phosphogluconolactonase
MTWIAPLLGSTLLGFAGPSSPPPDAPMWVFVGTYTGGKSRGIYRLTLDPASGKLGEPELAAESENPSFLAVHPSRRFLYAVNEVGQFEGKPGGGVTSFALDTKAGSLAKLNAESTIGGGPCHLSVDHTGKTLLVANYGGGSVAAFPIGDDGRIAKATTFIQHEGSGANKDRQSAPHAHSINVDKGNRFAVTADLGLDRLFVYKLDPARAVLTPDDPPFAAVSPGSGPRHFAFHPNGKYGYVINELASTIAIFDYDAERGVLTLREEVRTLPKGYMGTSFTAEVQVHPSGNFVYGSNRGSNSIAIFRVDPGNGLITLVEIESSGGKTPRNFGIDPSGRYLLAANQDSDSIVVFRINPDTGELTPTGQKVEVPKPVCVKFVPKGE